MAKCNLKTVRKASGLIEKYMTLGWYGFVKSLNLKAGDKLHLCVHNPVDRVDVRVERCPVS